MQEPEGKVVVLARAELRPGKGRAGSRWEERGAGGVNRQEKLQNLGPAKKTKRDLTRQQFWGEKEGHRQSSHRGVGGGLRLWRGIFGYTGQQERGRKGNRRRSWALPQAVLTTQGKGQEKKEKIEDPPEERN